MTTPTNTPAPFYVVYNDTQMGCEALYACQSREEADRKDLANGSTQVMTADEFAAARAANPRTQQGW